MSIFEQVQHLIKVENGKLVVNKPVLDQIRKLNVGSSGLYTIAIAGPYHQGKSYIMNLLAENQENMTKTGFQVGKVLRGQTLGIWVHAKKISNLERWRQRTNDIIS